MKRKEKRQKKQLRKQQQQLRKQQHEKQRQIEQLGPDAWGGHAAWADSHSPKQQQAASSSDLTQVDIDAAVDAVRVVERAGTTAAAAAAVVSQGAGSSGRGVGRAQHRARKLTTNISYAHSLGELQELLEEHRGSMNIIHITAFLSRCGFSPG